MCLPVNKKHAAEYFIIILLLFLSACSDDCKDVECMNGGSCRYGTCYCEDGYYGDRCEFYDSCYGVNCFNGGTCIEGICDCPEGYAGADCGTVLTPVNLIITRVDLDVFPEVGEGPGWDTDGPPDIFLTISPGVTATLSDFVSMGFTNMYAPLIFTTEHGFPMTITEPYIDYTIGAWDTDDDGYYLMDQKHFIPMNEAEGFPEKIHLAWPGWSCWLYVDWVF